MLKALETTLRPSVAQTELQTQMQTHMCSTRLKDTLLHVRESQPWLPAERIQGMAVCRSMSSFRTHVLPGGLAATLPPGPQKPSSPTVTRWLGSSWCT